MGLCQVSLDRVSGALSLSAWEKLIWCSYLVSYWSVINFMKLSPCQMILAAMSHKKHRTVQVLRLLSFLAQRWQKQPLPRWLWQPCLVLLTSEHISSRWEGKMTCSRGETLWLQGDSADFHHRGIWPTLPSMEGENKTNVSWMAGAQVTICPSGAG